MSTRTPQEAKEEVRNATDIVQVVGERVPLRRAGRAWKGLCPFHPEKTPSFTVNPERQIWHCFGCNRGGDVFSFLMELDKLTFPEALQALADRAGVELPRGERGAVDARRDRLHQATSLASDFFQGSLRTDAGANARAYLAGRGLEPAILERFHVGWAPAGWESLSTALGKLMPAAVLEEAGLTLRRGDGTHYDRFRNRIMFPIEGTAGKVAGFGARAIEPEDAPKYLNSPESPIYRKGGLLFGLPLARPAIRERKQVLVCEGYLDVMRLHASGQPHSVCTCGTALTLDQARSLARFEAEVVLIYDGDDAGIRAADRALEPLLRAGLQATILILPGGEDPDSFIVRHGARAFADALAGAMDPASFLAGARLESGGANPSPEARVRRYVELLRVVEDPIRRRLMTRRGAGAFGLEEDVLLEAVSRKGGSAARPARTPGRSPAGATGPADRTRRSAEAIPASGPSPAGGGMTPGGGAVSGTAVAESFDSLDPVERELAARCLLEDGAILEVISSGGANCFRSRTLRAMLQDWLTMGRAPLPEELKALESMDSTARGLLAESGSEEGRTDELSRRGARELLVRLEERRLRAAKADIDRAIRDAERAGNEPLRDRLVAERTELASKLHRRNPIDSHGRNHPAAS
ncbi:MAG TPA: DNA primase [Candidatus Eisenbacteria bacterium]|nr:DNA primase [Candidatus Eisenbacteria bacterium]